VTTDIIDHLGLAALIAHRLTIGLYTRGSIHVAEAPHEQRHEFAIGLIDPGTHLTHRHTLFGRKDIRHGVRLAPAVRGCPEGP